MMSMSLFQTGFLICIMLNLHFFNGKPLRKCHFYLTDTSAIAVLKYHCCLCDIPRLCKLQREIWLRVAVTFFALPIRMLRGSFACQSERSEAHLPANHLELDFESDFNFPYANHS